MLFYTQDLPVPVIAAIEGVAYGAAMQLALAADFRLAAPDARLSIREAKWGLIPDMGISQSLPRLMRADHAKELIMTGRVVTAEEAAALGLVTRVVAEPVAAARAMAAALVARSPDALAAASHIAAAWRCRHSCRKCSRVPFRRCSGCCSPPQHRR